MGDRTSFERGREDNLERLSRAGVPVDRLPEAARGIIADLSQEEVATLERLQLRMSEAGVMEGGLEAARGAEEGPKVGIIYY